MKKINIGTIVPSLEAIDFQSDTFGKEIEFAFESMLQNYENSKTAEESKECKNIQNIIYKRTGINVILVLDTDIMLNSSVPSFHKNHIFIQNSQRDLWKKHRDLARNKTNFINFINEIKQTTISLKTAKVTGLFSELTFPIFLNYSFFKKFDFSAELMTAGLLHEVGHIFVMLEMISRTNTTNQVLAYISSCVIGKVDNTEKKMIFKHAEELLGLQDNDLKNVYEQTDIESLTVEILNKSYKGVGSQTGSYGYDLTAVEQLADQFTNRFGYGRQIIELYDRLEKQFSGKYQSKENYKLFLWSDISVNLLITPLATFIALSSGSFIFGAASLMLILNLTKDFIFSGEANQIHTYDTMVTRPTRIRNDLIQAVKNAKIEKETVDLITKDIKLMDNIIDSYKDYTPLVTQVKNYLMSRHRDALALKQLQNDLENLAANKLFLQSAQLKTI
jgi:hypothetical protein